MNSLYTSASFAQAKQSARKNPGVVFTHDAGGGFTGVVMYCTWRKRVVCHVEKPEAATVAPQAVKVGDLVCVKVTDTYQIGARVREIDADRGILIRETVPLGTLPAGWEAAQFYARPETVFLAV